MKVEVYIKLKRKEDGSWEGKTIIDLKKLWYLEINKRLNQVEVNFGWRGLPIGPTLNLI